MADADTTDFDVDAEAPGGGVREDTATDADEADDQEDICVRPRPWCSHDVESRSPEGRHGWRVEGRRECSVGPGGRWTVRARKVGPGFNYRTIPAGNDTTDTDA